MELLFKIVDSLVLVYIAYFIYRTSKRLNDLEDKSKGGDYTFKVKGEDLVALSENLKKKERSRSISGYELVLDTSKGNNKYRIEAKYKENEK